MIEKHKPTVVMEMNHFCLNVLQRITVPDFLDFMRSVFPVLYAVDSDNRAVVDLHVPDLAYVVMHEHVVHNRFPNLVGGYSPEIKLKLESLVGRNVFETPVVADCAGGLVWENKITTMAPEQMVSIEVVLSNAGSEVWHGYGCKPVLLSYHWLEEGGNIYQYDGLRTGFACERLLPGESRKERIKVLAPHVPGRYQLLLTVLQEHVTWFENHGFEYCVAPIVVQ